MGISDKMEVADWPLLMNKKLASGSAISQNNSSDMQEAMSLKRDDFMESVRHKYACTGTPKVAQLSTERGGSLKTPLLLWKKVLVNK